MLANINLSKNINSNFTYKSNNNMSISNKIVNDTNTNNESILYLNNSKFNSFNNAKDTNNEVINLSVSNIKENGIPTKGNIASEYINLDRIATEKTNVLNKDFLNQNFLYKDVWEKNDKLSYDIDDGGVVAIYNGEIIIGYTDLEGIKDIFSSVGLPTNNHSYTNINNSHTNTNHSYTNINNSHTNTNHSHTNINNSHTNINNSYTNINNSHTNINHSHTNINNSHTNMNHSHTNMNHLNTNINNSSILTNINNSNRNIVEDKVKRINEFVNEYEDGQITFNVGGEEVTIDNILRDELSDYVNIEEILNIEKLTGQTVVTFQNGSSIHLLEGENSFIVGNNPDNTVSFGYYIDENNQLQNIDIFGEYNKASTQYGGSQMHFSEHSAELLSDPLIMNEIQAHFPGASYSECETYLNNLTAHGCGYTAYANAIIKSFEGREQEFRNRFGFDMYKIDSNGNIDYNYELLTLKWYTYIWGNGEYPITYADTGTSYDVMEKYGDFAAQYGINVNIYEDYNESYYNSTDVINQYNRIVNELGTTQIPVTGWEFDLYDMNGNLVSPNTGCHEMYVTGQTSNGNLIVSSWGEKLILDLSSLERNGGGMYFYNMGIEG